MKHITKKQYIDAMNDRHMAHYEGTPCVGIEYTSQATQVDTSDFEYVEKRTYHKGGNTFYFGSK